MEDGSYLVIMAVGLIFAMGVTDAYGQSEVSVSFDREMYVIPPNYLTEQIENVLVTITDPSKNLNNDTSDKIGPIENSTSVPLTIFVSRDSEKIILVTAGGMMSGGSILTVGEQLNENQYESGPIDESSDGGIFVYDLVVLYTDGPTSSSCPSIDSYNHLDTSDTGDSSIRFVDVDGNTPDGNFCILKGDTITAEYTYLDDTGMQKTISASATFTLTDAKLETDKEVYDIGSDIILKLTDSDLDFSTIPDEHGLDNIVWASDAATLTIESDGTVLDAFAIEGTPSFFIETGDKTGIFEATIKIPSALNGTALNPGEQVTLTYTDFTPASADYAGQANITSSVIIHISDPATDSGGTTDTNATGIDTPDPPDTNATGTDTSDPPVTQTVDSSQWDIGKVEWTKSGYDAMTENGTFQVTDPDQNTNTNSPDSFGVNVRSDTDAAGIAIMVRETGNATGIFEGEVSFTLTGRSTDGTLLVSSGDTITGEYEDHTPSAAYMVKDRPSVTDTATINVISVDEPDPNISIKLDKETYTWTDRVYINITSPDHNTDDRGRDKIGNAENPIRVATRGGHIDLYELEETDINTGVFVGELVLAGFAHDADGDASTGTRGDDVTDSEARGSGSKGGILPADNEDAVSVSFEYIDGKVIANNSAIQWNKGNASWIGLNFTTAGNGTFRVIDPDMNLDPSSVDNFDVHVRPAKKSGIDLRVTETGKATGIFEGIVFFTTDSPSDGELEVSLGDMVTGTYKDHTLPLPDDITKSMSIEVMVEILKPIIVPIVVNSTDTNSTGTNSTGTNSTDTDKDKSTTDKPKDAKPKTASKSDDKPQDTKPKTAQKSDDKPQDTKPKTTSKPDDKPKNDAKPPADPTPKADPKPAADKPTDPKPAPVQSTVDPDLVRCGPGTELVGGVCQASAGFDIVGWLFSWFR